MSVNLSPVGGAAAQFFDNNGNPLSGGKLYTYAAGTTTPLASYTTSAGNVPHTNPIILDSAGRVPGGQIWLTDGNVDYKFLLETSASVLVGTFDNIPVAISGTAADIVYLPAGAGAVATTVQAKLRESVSAKDFGAVGDGIADDTAALSAAFAAASYLSLDGVFKVTSPITLSKTNIEIHAYPGASINYAGSAGSTGVVRFNNVSTFIIDGQLTINCANLAGIGLEVRGANGAALVDISGVTVNNCLHSSPSTSGAAAIQVSCDSPAIGKVARVTNCIVSSVSRTTADGAGAVCTGISLEDFDVMVVENNIVDRVLKGNGTVDADGVKVFSQLISGAYALACVSIANNRVTNCEGRFVKTQTRGVSSIFGNYFALNTALALATSFRGVDTQIADASIENNTFELLTSWTGGSEMMLIQAQCNTVPAFSGQKISYTIANNSVFSAAGVPLFSRMVALFMTSMDVNANTVQATITNNTAYGAGGWAGAAVGTIGITVGPPLIAYAAGASANIVISGNSFNTANFMERFSSGVNATNAYDFAGKLLLTITGNYLPAARGDIAVLPHDANNSFTSSFCVYGNSVGTLGNVVAMPFNFANILGGNNFYVGAESTPARTNAPPNYTFSSISRMGGTMWMDSRVGRSAALAEIGSTPTWAPYGPRITSAYTLGVYSNLRTVPNSATITTVELGNILSSLLADLKLAGMAP